MSFRFRHIAIFALSLLIVGCSSTPKTQQPAELVEFDFERQLRPVWQTEVGNGQGKRTYNRLRPAIFGDTIYVAAENGRVLALNHRNGRVQWRSRVRAEISGGVGVSEQLVLLGTFQGEVIALNREDGSELWRRQLSSEILAPPQVDRGLVFVKTYDGNVLALDSKSGERRWGFSSSVPVLSLRGTSTPLVAGSMVLVGLANGRLVALDRDNGALRWEQRISVPQGSTEIERLADVDGDLLVEGGDVFAVGYQGQLVATEVRSGRRLWERDASSYVGMASGFGNIYVVEADGSITAHSRTGQAVIWTQTLLSWRRLTAPAILAGSIAVGDFEGYVHFLSQVDGSMESRIRVDGSGIRAPLLSHDGMLYVYTNLGVLAAYEFIPETPDREPVRRTGPRR